MQVLGVVQATQVQVHTGVRLCQTSLTSTLHSSSVSSSSPTRLPLSAPPSFPQELSCPLNGPRSPSRQTILLHHCQPLQCSRDDARKELHLFQPSPPDIYLSPVPLGHPSTLPCSVKISQRLLSAHSESGLLSLLMTVNRLCPGLPDNSLVFSLCVAAPP